MNKEDQTMEIMEIISAGKFSNMSRFIGDLATINDDGEFEKVYHEICPPDLKLKRENRPDAELSLLYLNIKISKFFKIF